MRLIRDFFVFCLVIIICGTWVFSGWPQVWHNPDFPPQVKNVYAATKTIEQQINIIDQEFIKTVSLDNFDPTDNSLGLIRWDSSKYNGATVYFEVVMRTAADAAGDMTIEAALFSSSGTQVTGSAVTTTNNSFERVRSGALTLDVLPNLESGLDYSVRIHRTTGLFRNIHMKAARLIIVQSADPSITDTQTQVEVGNDETSTATSYTDLTDKKIYRYTSGSWTPTPTVYFEASLKATGGGTICTDIGAEIGGGLCQVFLTTTGAGTFTVPADWDSGASAKIEVAGGGEGGERVAKNNSTGGVGGDGGDYSVITNLSSSAGSTIDYSVGAGGAGATSIGAGTAGNDTFFGDTTCAGSNVCAPGGGSGSTAVGTLSAGGAGGTSSAKGGSGGGGAGGPVSVGGAGGVGKAGGNGANTGGGGGGGSAGDSASAGSNSSSGTGAQGGSGYDGTAGGTAGIAGSNGSGGGGGSTDGGTGGNGGDSTNFDVTKGTGGGGGGGAAGTAGGGGSVGGPGGNGGLYGGGGGGGGASSGNGKDSGDGGDGRDGIIVITYTIAAVTDTAYAALYDSVGNEVSISEVSTTNTSWTRVRSSAITLSDATDYVVRIKASSGATAEIANAKIIFEQTDEGGIDELEPVHSYNNTFVREDAVGETTAYAELSISGGSVISGSNVSTTNTSYTRLRSSELTLSTNDLDVEVSNDNASYIEKIFINKYDSSNWAGGTFAYLFEATLKHNASCSPPPGATCADAASSWLIIQVTALAPAGTVSITVDDGTVAYGTLVAGATNDTFAIPNRQVVENNGGVSILINIKGGTTDSWDLTTTAGTDEFVHRFTSDDAGNVWEVLTDSYTAFATAVAVGATHALDLEIQVPTITTETGLQTADVTIQAVGGPAEP